LVREVGMSRLGGMVVLTVPLMIRSVPRTKELEMRPVPAAILLLIMLAAILSQSTLVTEVAAQQADPTAPTRERGAPPQDGGEPTQVAQPPGLAMTRSGLGLSLPRPLLCPRPPRRQGRRVRYRFLPA